MKLQSILLAGLAVLCPIAQSQQVKQNCLGIAAGVRNEYMADTGDGKGATLIAQNGHCGKPKHEDYRWRQISKAYRSFNQAVDSGNVDSIVGAAENLRVIAESRSGMFTSCWKTMISNAKLVEKATNGAVSALATAACVKQ